MNLDRWQRTIDLLHDALEAPPEERTGLVTRRTEADPALRDEVLSLLAADSSLAGRLDRPVADLLGTEADPVETRIGPYRVLGELGRGGAGVVYLAERADGEFRKRVAVKVLRHEACSEELLRRFRTERQILADLQHPHIATLHEGGTVEGRRPYFAMEYVDGEPIDVYCRRHALPVRRRVELMVKVCAAVERAHRNLVIHRDLKPTNILVDREGEPKLLDFGIAKVLDPAAAEQAPLTGIGPPPMTVQYASPEQLQGRSVTTATDVYGLGLVLYELAAGRRPFQGDADSAAGGRTPVRNRQPPSPSAVLRRGLSRGIEAAAVRGRRAVQEVAGDLDAIVLKALREEPEHRYGTVGHLRDDLLRYLDRRPVRARRDTLLYRGAMLLRRRTRSVVAGVTISFVLCGFAVDHELQSRQTERARERAQKAATYLAELFLFSRDRAEEARSTIPREILDRGAAIQAELEGEPELRADLMAAVGRSYLSLGRVDQAAPLLEGALRLRRTLHGPGHPAVAEDLRRLAWLRSGQARPRDAETAYREALAIRRTHLGEEHPLVDQLRNGLAAVLLDQGRYSEAEPLFRRVLAAKRAALGAGDPGVSAVAGNLGVVMFYRGRYDEARKLFGEVLDGVRERLPDDDPQVIAAKMNLAAALREAGDLRASGELLHEVLDVQRTRPATPALASTLEALAKNLLSLHELSEARDVVAEAASLYRTFFGPEHLDVARAETLLARIHMVAGARFAAEPLLHRALASYQRSQSPRHWRAAEVQSLLGECLLARGRLRDAEPLLRSSHRALRAKTGEQSLPTREAASRVARLEQRLGARPGAGAASSSGL